jgi:hypothetical protein
MAVSFYAEFSDMSTEQSQRVLEGLDLNGKSPTGQVFHAEGPLATGGTWVMDCWESPEALGSFVEQKLAPTMQRLGIKPPEPTLLPTMVFLTQDNARLF